MATIFPSLHSTRLRIQVPNTSLTAAFVVVMGLVGANFAQFLDPIARGITIESSGQGTAALSAKEPEALPFCAIAYVLTGIFGSLICSVPAITQNLLAINWLKVACN